MLYAYSFIICHDFLQHCKPTKKPIINRIDKVFMLKPTFYCTIIPEQMEAQYFIRLERYIIEHIKEYQRIFNSFSKEDQYCIL